MLTSLLSEFGRFGGALTSQLAMAALRERLLLAVGEGRVEDVLLAIHVDGANVSDPMQRTGEEALHLAVERGHIDVIDLLIDEGVDVDPEALSIAFDRGDPKLVTHLISFLNVNGLMSDGETPLHKACRHGLSEIVAQLIAAKADVNARTTTDGATPLFIASQWGHAEIVTKLLAANADVNHANNGGATPLYVASEMGHTEVVTTLIDANADVNQAKNNGTTPLIAACHNSQTAVVTALLAADADKNKANNGGATPLLIACEKGDTDIAAKLLAAGADVDKAPNDGVTPLYVACCHDHLGCVQLLSSYGASRTWPFAAPRDTAEHLTTHWDNHEIVAWLVRTRLWSTPLHHLEFLTPARALALLRAGADLDAAAEIGGPTPISLARELAAAGRAAEGTAAFVVLQWITAAARARFGLKRKVR